MFSLLLDIVNSLILINLLGLSIIEAKYLKEVVFFNKLLKNSIIKSGPVTLKFAQFFINIIKFKYYPSIPKFISNYDNIYNNLYIKNNRNIEGYKLIKSGSICSVYLDETNKKICKNLHFNSMISIYYYLNIIKYFNYFYLLPFDFSQFREIFLNQFNMNFERESQDFFYKKLDNVLIQIPETFSSNNTEIIMNYIPSQCIFDNQLNSIKCIKSISTLAIFLKYCYLELGLIHLDIHEGNWGVINNGIVIYDFGYVLKLYEPNDTNKKEVFNNLLFYVYTHDLKKLIDLIFNNFTNKIDIDYNELFIDLNKNKLWFYDLSYLISKLIYFSKKNKFKLDIKIYFILQYFIMIKYINKAFLSDDSKPYTCFKKKMINLLSIENAIINKYIHYKNIKEFNNKIIKQIALYPE